MKLYIYKVGFSLLLILSSVLITQSLWAELSVATQVQKIEDQKAELRNTYANSKASIQQTFLSRTKDLKDTIADRTRRKEIMSRMNTQLVKLQKDFKINMDSLEEVKRSLTSPNEERAIRLPPKLLQPVGLIPRMGEPNDLRDRIRRQDEILEKEKQQAGLAAQAFQPFPGGNVTTGFSTQANNPFGQVVQTENPQNQQPLAPTNTQNLFKKPSKFSIPKNNQSKVEPQTYKTSLF